MLAYKEQFKGRNQIRRAVDVILFGTTVLRRSDVPVYRQ
jgi:hypothetical protein